MNRRAKLPALKVRESTIENYLRDKVKKYGGIAYKFTSPSRRSVPDRIVILPGPRIIFVECKAPGKKSTPAQANEQQRLKDLGCSVYVIDSKEEVDKLLDEIIRIDGIL